MDGAFLNGIAVVMVGFYFSLKLNIIMSYLRWLTKGKLLKRDQRSPDCWLRFTLNTKFVQCCFEMLAFNRSDHLQKLRLETLISNKFENDISYIITSSPT